jgi:hypothetical protein
MGMGVRDPETDANDPTIDSNSQRIENSIALGNPALSVGLWSGQQNMVKGGGDSAEDKRRHLGNTVQLALESFNWFPSSLSRLCS